MPLKLDLLTLNFSLPANQFWTLFTINFSICACFVVTSHFVEGLILLSLNAKKDAIKFLLLIFSNCSLVRICDAMIN